MNDSTTRKRNKFIKPVPPYGLLVTLLSEVYSRTELPTDLHEKIETVLIESEVLTTQANQGTMVAR